MHTRTYKILNHDLADPVRTVDVEATPEEIETLAQTGYLIRERLFEGEALEALRTALDEVAAQEANIAGNGEGFSDSRRFGGLFLRHLMDKHAAFLDLLRFRPTLSVARAMLGPQVQVRGMTARISYPGQANQETHWHFHQRVVPQPLPPWFVRPHSIDCLIYLDDTDDANGPLCIVPGSHEWLQTELPADEYGDLPGQVTLRLPSGSVVLTHGSLWHRALPTMPQGTVRRLLILGYAPTWMRSAPYGVKPENGLTQTLLDGADTETRELLGRGGYT